MNEQTDPRLVATRAVALDAALSILQEAGVLGVTHAAVHARTGISRSTLYRHWPKLDALRNDAFLLAASTQDTTPQTKGPLRADLAWNLTKLVKALNESPWGQIAPQVIAAAATDESARSVINDFQRDRIATVESAFRAADERGELRDDVPIRHLVEMAIAVPYYRKLMAGLPLDDAWLDAHLDLICSMAVKPENA